MRGHALVLARACVAMPEPARPPRPTRRQTDGGSGGRGRSTDGSLKGRLRIVHRRRGRRTPCCGHRALDLERRKRGAPIAGGARRGEGRCSFDRHGPVRGARGRARDRTARAPRADRVARAAAAGRATAVVPRARARHARVVRKDRPIDAGRRPAGRVVPRLDPGRGGARHRAESGGLVDARRAGSVWAAARAAPAAAGAGSAEIGAAGRRRTA